MTDGSRAESTAAEGRVGNAALKRRLRTLLATGEVEAVAGVAAEVGHRVMGLLIALTYDRDPEVGWRAVEGLGVAAEQLVDHDPEAVRSYLRRLLWLISEESGGICWHAPQGMAEIVRRRPRLFGDYVPIVLNLLVEMADEDLDHFRPGVLWAIARLGPAAEEHLDDVLPELERTLHAADPQLRGLAVRALHAVGRSERVARARRERPALAEDDGPVALYGEGRLRQTTVGELVRRALEED